MKPKKEESKCRRSSSTKATHVEDGPFATAERIREGRTARGTRWASLLPSLGRTRTGGGCRKKRSSTRPAGGRDTFIHPGNGLRAGRGEGNAHRRRQPDTGLYTLLPAAEVTAAEEEPLRKEFQRRRRDVGYHHGRDAQHEAALHRLPFPRWETRAIRVHAPFCIVFLIDDAVTCPKGFSN